jgi:hypothetical protein
MFPQNNILANSYYLENHDEVEKAYNDINKLIQDLHERGDNNSILA